MRQGVRERCLRLEQARCSHAARHAVANFRERPGRRTDGTSAAVKEQIIDMAMNASGIRDTARVL